MEIDIQVLWAGPINNLRLNCYSSCVSAAIFKIAATASKKSKSSDLAENWYLGTFRRPN